LKNDLVQELTQSSHEYEKLREENSRIGKVEKCINYSLIPISAVITSLTYKHFTNGAPYCQPTEEVITNILELSGKTIGAVGLGGEPISISYPEIKSREEAIEYFMNMQRADRYFLGNFIYPILTNVFITPFILSANPGEKILKYPYALGKTLRKGIGKMNFYLKEKQELKQKRIAQNTCSQVKNGESQ
jgi:hypothetical protein